MLIRNACEYTVSVSKTLLTMCAASVGSRFTDCTSVIPAECLLAGPGWSQARLSMLLHIYLVLA